MIDSEMEGDVPTPSPEVTPSTESDSTSPVPDEERNGKAAATSPRLASITGFLMNQKSPKWNSNSNSDSAGTPGSPTSSESDQTIPLLTRSLRFEDEASEPRRTGSFSSMTHRRAAAAAAVASFASDERAKAVVNMSESDIRRFVFHHPRAKRLLSGLRVHAFTRQAFISSFTVGLAIGSLVAIVLKIMKDVACRMLYS